jgi:hypothetical protein
MHGFYYRAAQQYWLQQQPKTPETDALIEEAQREADAYKEPAEELTSWYRERYAARHPEAPKLAGVRVLAAWHPVGSEIATPAGHWQRQRVEDIPRERLFVIVQRGFGES